MDNYFITNEKPDIGTVAPLTQYAKRCGMKCSSDRYCIFCTSESTTVCNMCRYLFAITERITETVGHKSGKKIRTMNGKGRKLHHTANFREWQDTS